MGFHRSGVAGPLLTALNVAHLQTQDLGQGLTPDLQHQGEPNTAEGGCCEQQSRDLPWAGEGEPLPTEPGLQVETFSGKLGS